MFPSIISPEARRWGRSSLVHPGRHAESASVILPTQSQQKSLNESKCSDEFRLRFLLNARGSLALSFPEVQLCYSLTCLLSDSASTAFSPTVHWAVTSQSSCLKQNILVYTKIMSEIHKFVCWLSTNPSLLDTMWKCLSMPFHLLFHFRKWSISDGQSEGSLQPKDPASPTETEEVWAAGSHKPRFIWTKEEIRALSISPTMALSRCSVPLQ